MSIFPNVLYIGATFDWMAQGKIGNWVKSLDCDASGILVNEMGSLLAFRATSLETILGICRSRQSDRHACSKHQDVPMVEHGDLLQISPPPKADRNEDTLFSTCAESQHR
jgi:hypothetical protein